MKLILLVLSLCMAACSTVGVKPWDRDLMADPDMQVDANAVEQSFNDHIYFSKEASSGGASYAGGGCGCN